MRGRKSKGGWLAEIIDLDTDDRRTVPPDGFIIGHWLNRNDSVIVQPVWTAIMVPTGSVVLVLRHARGEILFDNKPVIVPKSCIRKIDETEAW